jgi:hypothetical protein
MKTCMLLNTITDPFHFGRADEVHDDVKAEGDVKVKVGKTKGGAMSNSGEVLKVRRPKLKEYFPPSVFDCHRTGSIDRDEAAIRKLIPKEVWSANTPNPPRPPPRPHPSPLRPRSSRMWMETFIATRPKGTSSLKQLRRSSAAPTTGLG